MRRARAHRGFTLIEVLVALAILAVFATFVWRATTSLVEGEARLSAEARRWQTLDAMFARLEVDVRAAIPRPVRAADRREPAWIGDVGPDGRSAFTFTRAGGEPGEPGAAGLRIGYRMRGETAQFLLWPILDREAGVEPVAYSLADGVAGLDVRYADEEVRWTDRWPPDGRDGLPHAIAVGVTLAEGGRIERLIVLR